LDIRYDDPLVYGFPLRIKKKRHEAVRVSYPNQFKGHSIPFDLNELSALSLKENGKVTPALLAGPETFPPFAANG
jgi:hypothetical protein